MHVRDSRKTGHLSPILKSILHAHAVWMSEIYEKPAALLVTLYGV
ncbi:hypothetical protein AB434_0434 [Heyndrickxia coagulans]|uniref:Uncharacterized protein n=1 Tax=Heyndrickxia coagulans TaxID=1398 RepID=A0AAN0T375_HEYCO|nr:hypothetical protein SB48_HM08orf01143 [Heyndrickxia coagulans]AKN52839.1 hypothetical protein AB434_0434 [Heyndrickxia coagulans]